MNLHAIADYLTNSIEHDTEIESLAHLVISCELPYDQAKSLLRLWWEIEPSTRHVLGMSEELFIGWLKAAIREDLVCR
jgi:hypothetical protein